MSNRRRVLQGLLASAALLALFGCTAVPKAKNPPLSGYVCASQNSWLWPEAAEDVLKAKCREPGKDSVVVFVHGLQGDSVKTWFNTERPPHEFWPSLVKDDPQFGEFNVYSYGFKTGFIGDHPYVTEIVDDMAARFDKDGVLQHEHVYFVVHSMGGIITRNFILERARQRPNIRLIHYFATPGKGSPLASLISGVGSAPIPGLATATPDSALSAYQRLWNSSAEWTNPPLPKVACTCETAPMYESFLGGLPVVPRESCASMCLTPTHADPAPSIYYAEGKDHSSVVKPDGYGHVSYWRFREELLKARPPVGAQAPLSPPTAPRPAPLGRVGCPTHQNPFSVDLSQPYDGAVLLSPGDFIVMDSPRSDLVPTSMTGSGAVPLESRHTGETFSACTGQHVAKGIGSLPAMYFVQQGPGPAMLRFTSASGTTAGLSGKVSGRVFSATPELGPRVTPTDDTSTGTSTGTGTGTGTGTSTVTVTPPPLTPALCEQPGDIRCFRFASGIAFASGDITALGELSAPRPEVLLQAVIREKPARVVVRGFASPERLTCMAWRKTAQSSPVTRGFGDWPCRDGKDTGGNLLLSLARAEIVKEQLAANLEGVPVDAVGCGVQYAAAKDSQVGAARGVVVEVRRDATASDLDPFGCTSLKQLLRGK